MVSRVSRCDSSRLRSLLSDELTEPERENVIRHLDHCESCRRTLEELAAGSRLWSDLRDLRNPVPTRDRDGFADRHAPLELTPAHGYSDQDVSLAFLAPSERPGSLGRLGTYEITELLGHGGSGVVLKAFDAGLGRTVAIKVLAPHLAINAAARSRFAREARAAAAVVHENVVAIYAVDSWNGLPYLVMPCIAGRSLQERVDRDGPLAVREILRIGMQAALGLAAAHEQGLVHRDIKPSNILLENGVERVKLSDFGLARAVDDASLTQSGVVAGTPQYMSPEQARGDAVDHRSDLFSLGSVMYFMCAGHPPFRAGSTPAVLRRVSDERPRPLREINVETPDWLAEIVDRLLAKDPQARYSSAGEVAGVMKHHLAELQRTGTSASLQRRSNASAPSRRRVGGQVAVAAGLLIGAVLFGGAMDGLPNHVPSFLFAPAGGAQDSKTAGGGTGPGVTVVFTRDHQDGKPPMIVGSGQSATKTWDVSGFTGVKIESTFRAEIIKGEGFKVITSADDNILEHLRVVKEGAMLRVGLEKGSYQLKTPLKAEITLPALEDLGVSGASKSSVTGFRSDAKFRVDVSGASSLDGTINAGDADIQVSGASTVALSGSAKASHLKASGASHIKLAEFPLDLGRIELSGASTAVLSVRSQRPFKGIVAGASSLEGTIQGGGIDLRLSGASRVKVRGTAKSAKITAEGTSQADLGAMVLDDADVTLTGASGATVDAKQSLKYTISSASTLNYLGTPASLTGSKTSGATIRQQR
jgi:serine/threonine-protein kinase